MRLGMMLSWAVFFELFKSKPANEKSDLGTYLRRQGVAHEYLKFLFANMDAKIGLPEAKELLTLLLEDHNEDYHTYVSKVRILIPSTSRSFFLQTITILMTFIGWIVLI